MRILFLHRHFPGQFRHLARALGSDSRHTVVFGTAPPAGNIPGVSVGLFRGDFEAAPATHPLNRPVEEAVRIGQDAYRLARNLSEMNFIPDVIYGHSGSGSTLFMKDLFPRSKLLCYFEWYHRAAADPAATEEEAQRSTFAARLRNIPVLSDLYACDGGLSPTAWQRDQFPPQYHDKIEILHEGIDSAFFTPAPVQTGLDLPRLGLRLPSATAAIITLAQGPDLPRSLKLLEPLLEKHPAAHAVIAGTVQRPGRDSPPQEAPDRDALLDGSRLDPARVHTTGPLSLAEYRSVLRASALHLEPAPSAILTWQLLEALSSGCLLLACDTPAVREAIRDGENGFLADPRDRDAFAARALDIFERRSELAPIRTHARKTILESYALADLVPRQIAWIEEKLG